MDIKRLANMRFGIITEDSKQTPDPEKLVDNFVNQQVEAGNMVEENQPKEPEPQQNNSHEQQPQEPQQDLQQQGQDPEGANGEDNPYALDDQNPDVSGGNSNQQGMDTNIPDVPDDYNSQDDTPKLKILQSLTDKEYKLNNIHCHEQFKELYNNVENSINNYIMNIVTKNEKQRQVVNFVHNNLSMMLDDLNTYIVYKFGDIYEDNILAYTTFLKRYHIAMKIMEYIHEENLKAKN